MTKRAIIAIILLLLVRNLALTALLQSEQRKTDIRIAALKRKIARKERAAQKHYPPINVYGSHVLQGDEAFLDDTRFTKLQFNELLAELAPLIRRNRRVRYGVPEPTGRERSCKATLPNRLLMVLKWLVRGGTCTSIGHDFGVDHHAVSEEIRHVTYAIVEGIQYEVCWPNDEQQALLKRTFGENYDDVIAIADGTFTRSRRRHGDFSGHRHGFVRTHQVVTDAFGFVLHVLAGLAGGRHDSHNLQLSDVPRLLRRDRVRLLGDDGYVGMENIVTPPSSSEFPDADQRARRYIDHTNRRSRIEQYFSVLKQWFTVCGRRWDRADRRFLGVVFVACCMLHNRRKRLNA